MGADQGMGEHIRMARQGADAQSAVLQHHATQIGDACEVDEHRRRLQAQRQCRNQALAAGNIARLAIGLREAGDGLLQGAGADIGEGAGFHAGQPQRRFQVRSICDHLV